MSKPDSQATTCQRCGYSAHKDDVIRRLDIAMKDLVDLFQETRSTEIGDALEILSAWREQYSQDNSQFGVGA